MKKKSNIITPKRHKRTNSSTARSPGAVARGAEAQYEASGILKHAFEGNTVLYKVLWRYWPQAAATWQTFKDLENAQEVLRAYFEKVNVFHLPKDDRLKTLKKTASPLDDDSKLVFKVKEITAHRIDNYKQLHLTIKWNNDEIVDVPERQYPGTKKLLAEYKQAHSDIPGWKPPAASKRRSAVPAVKRPTRSSDLPKVEADSDSDDGPVVKKQKEEGPKKAVSSKDDSNKEQVVKKKQKKGGSKKAVSSKDDSDSDEQPVVKKQKRQGLKRAVASKDDSDSVKEQVVKKQKRQGPKKAAASKYDSDSDQELVVKKQKKEEPKKADALEDKEEEVKVPEKVVKEEVVDEGYPENIVEKAVAEAQYAESTGETEYATPPLDYNNLDDLFAAQDFLEPRTEEKLKIVKKETADAPVREEEEAGKVVEKPVVKAPDIENIEKEKEPNDLFISFERKLKEPAQAAEFSSDEEPKENELISQEGSLHIVEEEQEKVVEEPADEAHDVESAEKERDPAMGMDVEEDSAAEITEKVPEEDPQQIAKKDEAAAPVGEEEEAEVVEKPADQAEFSSDEDPEENESISQEGSLHIVEEEEEKVVEEPAEEANDVESAEESPPMDMDVEEDSAAEITKKVPEEDPQQIAKKDEAAAPLEEEEKAEVVEKPADQAEFSSDENPEENESISQEGSLHIVEEEEEKVVEEPAEAAPDGESAEKERDPSMEIHRKDVEEDSATEAGKNVAEEGQPTESTDEAKDPKTANLGAPDIINFERGPEGELVCMIDYHDGSGESLMPLQYVKERFPETLFERMAEEISKNLY